MESPQSSTTVPSEPVYDSSLKGWILWSGSKLLLAGEYAGGKIAGFLGFTGPKFHEQIDEYEEYLAAVEARNKKDVVDHVSTLDSVEGQ
ncbi:hypothetical protein RCL1_002045 [Eukaryota sp. TZLM3-RCL]